jgi:hypothetical protein
VDRGGTHELSCRSTFARQRGEVKRGHRAIHELPALTPRVLRASTKATSLQRAAWSDRDERLAGMTEAANETAPTLPSSITITVTSCPSGVRSTSRASEGRHQAAGIARIA